MKPTQFINQLESNFTDILDIGFIVNGEIKGYQHKSDLDPEDVEGLVMRLYFLGMDPNKQIKFFINQYAENRFLYYIKISDEVWLFVLSDNNNFAKLHFFIQYLLSDIDATFEDDEHEEQPLTEEQEKMESAKRIQNLLFPSMSKLLEPFSDAYFYYEPKDVVGGDFYWGKTTKEHQWIIIGDCTGHSVEGALGSVSVMSILNQVFEHNMSPHLLIKALHKGLNDIQEQDLTQGYGIGCEIMVIKYHKKSHTLEYSSNGLSMYLMRDGITKYKTKSSSFAPERVLKYIRSRKIKLGPNDAIFTCSDGLPDQIGKNGRKLKVKGMLAPIKEHKEVSKKTIEDAFMKWKGNAPQTDDVIFLYLKA